MRNFAAIAIFAIVAVLGLTSAATAATIEVTNVAAELPNIEVAGRLTFRSNVTTIVCDKTMRGQLNRRVEGELRLLGNSAGIIDDIRFSNCAGGTFRALVNLTERAVRLSWVDVRNGVSITLGVNNFRFALEMTGVTCLYTAEMNIRAAPEVRGLYRERFELTLLRLVAAAENSIFCSRAEVLTLIGSLTVTRPSVGIGVSLR